MPQNETTRWPAIPIPLGGFTTDEAEADWLEATLVMRMKETLSSAGLNVAIKPGGLRDFLLISMKRAARRAELHRLREGLG